MILKTVTYQWWIIFLYIIKYNYIFKYNYIDIVNYRFYHKHLFSIYLNHFIYLDYQKYLFI